MARKYTFARYEMTFQETYDEHKKAVFNLSLQYVQNVEDAEEVTQDVFVKVYENISRFRNEASVRTWIYRITINQSLDYLKAKKRRKRAFLSGIIRMDDADKYTDIPNFNHPGIELEQKETLELIFVCLNRLPENQRTVVILLKIERLSQQETADIMKISTKAVESLFQRAKKNLEKLWNENEGK